jgi:Ca2+-binding EF-hand superfamily protein
MAAYKAADRSGNGFVERKEYGYLLRYMVYYNNLWNLFATIDDDGDRRISLDEFMAAASKLDLPGNAQDVFAEIDVNGGGMILFNELVHWMAIHKSTWGTDDADVEQVQQKLEATTVDKEMEMPTTLAPPPPPPEPVPQVVIQIDIPDKETGMKLFDQLDENASGKLPLAELDKGVVTLFPGWNNKPAIMAAYKAADRSGNGFVERNEFGYFLRYIVYYNNLWSLFASMDDNGDRRITKQEFTAAASKLNLPRDAQDVFDEIDENKGGMILFDELIHWMATWGSE